MTKITLLTAASVAAIAFAGAAQAGVITGSVNTKAATAAAPYTIAAERANAADLTTVGGFVVANTITTANQPNITTGAPAQTYSVVFDITGGTIPTTAAASVAVISSGADGTAATSTFVQGARSANSIQFIVTVNAPATASTTATVQGFTLTTQAANSNAENSIAVAGTVSVLAGGVTTQIDSTAATTLVRYTNALGAFSVTSNKVFATLPSFTGFSTTSGTTPGATTAELATNYTVASTDATAAGNAQNAFYRGLSAAGDGVAVATTVVSSEILDGAVLKVTGGNQLNTLVPSLAVTDGAAPVVRTASDATFTLNDLAADTMLLTTDGRPDLILTQTTPTATVIAPAAFTTTYAPVYAMGFTAPAVSAAVPSGEIVLDGVNFIAPWVSGSQSTNQTVIRLSNGGAANSGMVTLRLSNAVARAAGVTTGPGSAIANQTCGTSFTIPSTGDLQIGGAELVNCFGNFLRGDVQITVQSASTNLTAKMRVVASDGGTYESSLGRFSGATATEAAF